MHADARGRSILPLYRGPSRSLPFSGNNSSGHRYDILSAGTRHVGLGSTSIGFGVGNRALEVEAT